MCISDIVTATSTPTMVFRNLRLYKFYLYSILRNTDFVMATAMSYTGSLLSLNRYLPISVRAAAESIASVPTRFFSKYGVASRPCKSNNVICCRFAGLMAEEKIYDFMKTYNRPFSITEIQKNSAEYPKGDIQKALQTLIENDKIFEKTYGKQKIYCICQEQENIATNMDDELKGMDRHINTLTSELDEINKQLRAKTGKLQEQQKKMTVDEAISEKNKLEKEILALKEELKSFEECSKPISESERVKVCEEYHKYEKEYKRRKRIFQDIINQIMDNYPKSEKVLLGEIGVETDEDVGFKYEPILK